jgi:hypothetical protein
VCAQLACAEGRHERAARLFGATQALWDAAGVSLSWATREELEKSVAPARAALGEEAFAAAWTVGQAMSLDDAVACALES